MLQQWNATHSPGPCACSLNCLSVCVSGRFKIPFCSNSKCYFISLESICDWSFRSHLEFYHGWNMTGYQMHILLRFLNEKTRIWHVVFRKQSRQSDYVRISTKFLQNNLQESFSSTIHRRTNLNSNVIN